MSRTEKVRLSLSDWRFWMVIAYCGLVLVVVGLYFVNNRTSHAAATVAKESAVHQAELTAAQKAAELAKKQKVDECEKSIPQIAKINRFVNAVQDAHEVLSQNAKALLEATSPADPTYPTRLRNYRRIASTLPAISVVRFHVPTMAECKRLGRTP